MYSALFWSIRLLNLFATMTMGDELPVTSLVLPVLIRPVLTQVSIITEDLRALDLMLFALE